MATRVVLFVKHIMIIFVHCKATILSSFNGCMDTMLIILATAGKHLLDNNIQSCGLVIVDDLDAISYSVCFRIQVPKVGYHAPGYNDHYQILWRDLYTNASS